eukprot:6468989-Amphidinium_carterae.2
MAICLGERQICEYLRIPVAFDEKNNSPSQQRFYEKKCPLRAECCQGHWRPPLSQGMLRSGDQINRSPCSGRRGDPMSTMAVDSRSIQSIAQLMFQTSRQQTRSWAGAHGSGIGAHETRRRKKCEQHGALDAQRRLSHGLTCDFPVSVGQSLCQCKILSTVATLPPLLCGKEAYGDVRELLKYSPGSCTLLAR